MIEWLQHFAADESGRAVITAVTLTAVPGYLSGANAD